MLEYALYHAKRNWWWVKLFFTRPSLFFRLLPRHTTCLIWKCSGCYEVKPVKFVSSRTCYPWNGEGKDPNADRILCKTCEEYHHDYWDEMWREYYSGRL